MEKENLKTSHNSGYTLLRILWLLHVHVSQELLSLTENKRLRSSQQSCSRGNVGSNHKIRTVNEENK
jgi:hypothetical protein